MQRLYYRHSNGEKFRVLDKGEIIEQGTHEELLKRKGQYYRLWEVQQGNFRIEKTEEKENYAPEKVEEDDLEGVMSYT